METQLFVVQKTKCNSLGSSRPQSIARYPHASGYTRGRLKYSGTETQESQKKGPEGSDVPVDYLDREAIRFHHIVRIKYSFDFV